VRPGKSPPAWVSARPGGGSAPTRRQGRTVPGSCCRERQPGRWRFCGRRTVRPSRLMSTSRRGIRRRDHRRRLDQASEPARRSPRESRRLAWRRYRWPVPVAAGKRVGLAMAVRTEKVEVLDAIVQAVAIDVVQRHRKWPSAPVSYAAAFAPILLQASREEALLEVPTVPMSVAGKDFFQRLKPWPRDEQPAAHGIRPRCLREPEGPLTFADAVAGVVVRLHGRPVVPTPAPLVDLLAQPARVVGDSRFGQVQASSHLGAGESLAQEACDALARGDRVA
jgi:hypothetical protein